MKFYHPPSKTLTMQPVATKYDEDKFHNEDKKR
jgi:hypothetical protein